MGFLSSVAQGLSSLAARLDAATSPALPQYPAAAEVIRSDAARADDCGGGGCGNYDSPFGPAFTGGLGLAGLSRDQIDALCVSQFMTRIVHVLIEDAVKISPDLSGPDLGQLDDVWDYLCEAHYQEEEFRALSYSRKYGGGGLIIIAEDGGTLGEEMDLARVQRVRGFVPLERNYLIPGPASGEVRGSWWGPRWGRPLYYTAAPPYGLTGDGFEILSGTAIHPSRIIPFPYRRELNWRQARLYTNWSGWGPGVVEAIVEAYLARVRGILRTGDIVNSFGYDHVSNEALHDMLSSPDGKARVRNFLNFVKECRDYTGDGVPMVVTGPEAHLTPVNRTVTGLAELIEAQREFLLDCTEYPRIVIFGETASGLGSGAAEGEWQQYYQVVSAYQENVRWRGIRHAAIVCMAAKDGPTSGRIDFGITAAWASLEQEKESEVAENRKRNAEARAIDAEVLGISPKDLIAYDNTLEGTYPGIQAAAENGTLNFAASIVPLSPADPLDPNALPTGSPIPPPATPSAPAPTPGHEGETTSPTPTEPGAEDQQEEQAPPAEPAPTIPTDLISEADARRLLRCGRATFINMAKRGLITPWLTYAGRRYSMAELVSAFKGTPPETEEPEGEERSDAMRGDPFSGEHAARQVSPNGLKGFRRKTIAPGVTLILAKRGGAGPMITQSIRLSASEFSPSEAREWLEAHGYKTGLEEASGGRSDRHARMDAAALDHAARSAGRLLAG